MQITRVIIAGSVAALAILATPALAKNFDGKASDVQQNEASATPCYSYEPKPDGSWTQLPCQEVGAATPVPRKSAARSPDQDPRTRHAVR